MQMPCKPISRFSLTPQKQEANFFVTVKAIHKMLHRQIRSHFHGKR